MGRLSRTRVDRAREKRWVDQLLPSLVVGDAVWLDARRRSAMVRE
jgi:hypothetical protein